MDPRFLYSKRTTSLVDVLAFHFSTASFSPTLRAVVGVAAFLAFGWGFLHAVPAEANGEGGVAGFGCDQIASENVVGACPPAGGPQRDDPWLPTIELPSPDDELGESCGSISVTISHINFLNCPPTSFPYAQPIMGFGGATAPAMSIPVPAPDYDGDYDAIPIRLCFNREDVPSVLYIDHPEHDRFIGSAKATVYCCEDC